MTFSPTPARQNVKIYILGLPGKFRNQQQIENSTEFPKIFKFYGVNKESKELDQLDLEARVFHFWHNRGITRAEAACAIGHRKIVNRAFEDSVDIAIILEDDARIPTNSDISSYTKILNTDKPILLMVAYAPQDVLLCRRKLNFQHQEILRCRSTPQVSQSYVLNRAGICAISRYQNSRGLDSLADFPPWYFDILDFYAIPVPDELASSNDSIIGEIGRTAQPSNFIRRLYRFTLLAWFVEGYRYCNLTSYIRYVHGRALASLKLKIMFLLEF